ncbi:MAG: hypothetical protein ACI9FR_000467 [Cryomorphaceae bacterium]
MRTRAAVSEIACREQISNPLEGVPMNSSLIYWPVLAQLAIPVWVLLLNGKRKTVDRNSGNLDPNSPTDNTAWSLPVVLTSNALANQFQLPIIFYVLCLILADIGAVNGLVLGVCWAFVATRLVHVYVHVMSNYVPSRQKAFIAGTLILLLLFGLTIYNLAAL